MNSKTCFMQYSVPTKGKYIEKYLYKPVLSKHILTIP